MTIFTGVIVYLLTFTVVMFTTFSWGNTYKREDKPAEQMGGAPENPNLKKKFLATALISAVIWVIVFILIKIEIIDFYAISQGMMEEDFGE